MRVAGSGRVEERVHVDAGHGVTPAMAEDLRTFLA